jgi:hypothetical protein
LLFGQQSFDRFDERIGFEFRHAILAFLGARELIPKLRWMQYVGGG